MGLFGFLFKTPLGIVISLFSSVILVGVIVVAGVSAMALTGGPAPCTPGGGTIEISDAQAAAFDQKWDQLDVALNGGASSSISLNESEISSRANKYIDDRGGDVDNVRVCIHDGFGEVTGSVDVAVGNGDFKVKGTVALSGGQPVVDFQDVELGNVPGFALAPFENAVEDAIQELLDDITLDHTYTPTLTEGKAEISGTP